MLLTGKQSQDMWTAKRYAKSGKGGLSRNRGVLLLFFVTWFHLGVFSLPLLLTSVLAPQIRASLSYHSVLPEFLGHHGDQSSKKD